jgi:Mg-chelatase subunit ChlI
VREIYQLGLKHGMNLAAISGVNGVFTDEDIERVRKLALAARAKRAARQMTAKPAPSTRPGNAAAAERRSAPSKRPKAGKPAAKRSPSKRAPVAANA